MSSTKVRINEAFLDDEIVAPVVVVMDTEPSGSSAAAGSPGIASGSAISGAIALLPEDETSVEVPLRQRPDAEAILLQDINRWVGYLPALGPIYVSNGQLVLDRARSL